MVLYCVCMYSMHCNVCMCVRMYLHSVLLPVLPLFQTPEKQGAGVMGAQSPGASGHARSPSVGGHTRTSSIGHRRGDSQGGAEENISFEDRRKENFEAGRLELERRRKAIKEQQEREAVGETNTANPC